MTLVTGLNFNNVIIKVAELRQELMARDLETKGVKTVLCARLQEALDKEKAEEEGKAKEVILFFPYFFSQISDVFSN